MSCVIIIGIIIGICVCVVGILGIALAFFIKDNDFLKSASDSQSMTFTSLRDANEIQAKYIVKLENELKHYQKED